MFENSTEENSVGTLEEWLSGRFLWEAEKSVTFQRCPKGKMWLKQEVLLDPIARHLLARDQGTDARGHNGRVKPTKGYGFPEQAREGENRPCTSRRLSQGKVGP